MNEDLKSLMVREWNKDVKLLKDYSLKCFYMDCVTVLSEMDLPYPDHSVHDIGCPFVADDLCFAEAENCEDCKISIGCNLWGTQIRVNESKEALEIMVNILEEELKRRNLWEEMKKWMNMKSIWLEYECKECEARIWVDWESLGKPRKFPKTIIRYCWFCMKDVECELIDVEVV